jgi:hypothetical protein
MVGTANYVAPEQIEGGRVDGRADQYSLGCVLYECLTGRAPFTDRNPAAILYAHIHDQPPPPSSLRQGLPAGIDAATERALRKVPDERYSSCRELSRDLRAAIAGSPATPMWVRLTTAPRGRAAPRTRTRFPWAAVAAVVSALVVAVAAVVFVGLRGGAGQSPSPSAPAPRLIREGVQVTASSTAPSSTDAAGNPVTFVPANVIDGMVQTAWRTPGAGHGESITLIFDNPIEVDRIGLIPGYAKTDPQTGANRFLQDRIIEAVAYEIPGLPNTRQTFEPIPAPQFTSLDVTTSRITVRILDTTASGGLDYTAISEIYVYGFEQ